MIDDLEQNGAGKGVDQGGADSNLFARSSEKVGLSLSDVLGFPVAGVDEGLHEADATRPEDLVDWQQPR